MNLLWLFREDRPLFLQTLTLILSAAALPFSATVIRGNMLLFVAISLYLRYKQGAIKQTVSELACAPLFWPWLAYFAAGILSAAFSVDAGRSFAMISLDLLSVTVFLGLSLFITTKNRDLSLGSYLFTICLAAAIGIFQSLWGFVHGLDIRAHSTTNPVRFGETMVIGLGLALSFSAFHESLSSRVRRFLGAAILLAIPAIELSQTRSAYLGMALLFPSLLVVRPQSIKALRRLLGVAALLWLALEILMPSIHYKVISIFLGDKIVASDNSISTRLTLWRIGFKIIKNHPVFGVGPANVATVFPDYCPRPYPENTRWATLHNLYIHQTAERGFIGLAALLALFAGMLLVAWRNYRYSSSPYTLWALIILPSWFIMNVAELPFQYEHASYAVLLALGVSIAAIKGR